MSTSGFYKFDDVTIDCENFSMQRCGEIVPLTPRAFDLLIFLIRNRGHVVEKQEIFDSVWKGTFVSDNALTKLVKEIRHALHDSAEHPRYIETVVKRGYRFVGCLEGSPEAVRPAHVVRSRVAESENAVLPSPIEERLIAGNSRFSTRSAALMLTVLTASTLLAAWLVRERGTGPSPPAHVRSIAVLPFKSLDPASRDESLELGMAEAVITRLNNLDQLTVRPLTAVSKYNQPGQEPVDAGRATQVDAVLDGTIQRSGDRVRITAKLIDVESGRPIWSEQFDDDFTDIFKVQDSISRRISEALSLHLTREETERLSKRYTNNPEAYQSYLQGQLIFHARQRSGSEGSLAAYQKAIELDPEFALAYVGVAECLMKLSTIGKFSGREAAARAKPNVIKALEIDNTLAEAHNALAEVTYQFDYDWAAADKEFHEALRLNPNVAMVHMAYGWFLMMEGRFDDAGIEIEEAKRLDPSSIVISSAAGNLFLLSRQYDRGIQHYRTMVATESVPIASNGMLFNLYLQKHMYQEAAEAHQELLRLAGASLDRIARYRTEFQTSGWTGYVRKMARDAESRTDDKGENWPPSQIARLYSLLGQRDEAIKLLEAAFEEGDPFLVRLKVDPAFDNLRDDARFVQMIARLNYPD